MNKKYSVKLSIVLTNKEMSVLKKALKDYSLVVGAYDKAILDGIIDLVNNADESAKRKLNSSE